MALHDDDELLNEVEPEQKYGLGLDKAYMYANPQPINEPILKRVSPLMLGKDEEIPDYPRWAGATPSTQPNNGPVPAVNSYAVSFPTNIGEGHFIHVEDMYRVSQHRDLCSLDINEDSVYSDTKFPEMKQYVYSFTSTPFNVMYPNGVVLPVQQNRSVVSKLTEFAKQHKLSDIYSCFNTSPNTPAMGVMIISYYKVFNINAHNLNRNFTAGLNEMLNYYNPGRANAMFPSASLPHKISEKIIAQGDDRLLESIKTQVGNLLSRPNGYVNHMYVREIRFVPETVLTRHPNGVFIPSTGLVIGGMKLLQTTQHMYASGANKASMHTDTTGASGSVVIDLVDNQTDSARYMKVGEKFVPILPRQDIAGKEGVSIKYHRSDGIVQDIIDMDINNLEQCGIFKSEDACRRHDPATLAQLREQELATKQMEITKKYESAKYELQKVREENENLKAKSELELNKLTVEKERQETELLRLQSEMQKQQNQLAKYEQEMEMMRLELDMAKQKHTMTMEELGAKRYLSLLEFSTEYETLMLNMREKRLDFMWKVQSGVVKQHIDNIASQYKIQELQAKRDYETSKFMADTSMSSLSIAGRILKMVSL